MNLLLFPDETPVREMPNAVIFENFAQRILNLVLVALLNAPIISALVLPFSTSSCIN